MNTLAWIILGGLAMSAIAMVGGLTTVLSPVRLEKSLPSFLSLAAGTLLGGAFFHMIPEGSRTVEPLHAAAWLMGGFTTFLGLEQFLHWHHTHHAPVMERKPVTYLVLIGDALHNFLGGMGIASTFLLDPRAGMIAWVAGAAHEVPQELGDFGVLVHGGWPRRQALLWNFLCALTFPLGAIFAYLASQQLDVSGLVLFGAGNFVYIAASDLVPEIKVHSNLSNAALRFGFILLGLALTYGLAAVFLN